MRTFYVFLFVSLIGLANQAYGQATVAQTGLERDKARLEQKMNDMRAAKAPEVAYPTRFSKAAKSEVTMFKGRHPEQDVSAYEKEISDFEAFLEQREANASAEAAEGEDFEDAYEEAMHEAYSSLNLNPRNASEQEIATVQNEYNRITAKIDAFPKSTAGQSASGLAPASIPEVMSKITNAHTSLEGELITLKRTMTTGYDRASMIGSYLEMLVLEKFWNANGILFPSNPDVKDGIAKVAALHREVGSMENVEANCKRNSAAHLKTVTMEPARAHDAAIEAEMKKVFLATGWAPGETVTKVNLYNSSWFIKRHEVTGVILARTWDSEIVTKDNQGRCWVHRFGLFARYDGSKYLANEALYTFDQEKEILCENVR